MGIRSRETGQFHHAANGKGLLDHFVGLAEEHSWNFKTKATSRLQIDHELELGRSEHREIGWLLPLENSSNVQADLAICIRKARPVAVQAPMAG
jgi:hypothetical protein